MISAVDATIDFLRQAEPDGTSPSARPTQRIEYLLGPGTLAGMAAAGTFVTSTCSERTNTVTASRSDSLFFSQQELVPLVQQAGDVVRTLADVAVAQLIRLENFHEDWDGRGGEQPIIASFRDAKRFVRALAPESVFPKPTLHAAGHAMLFLRGPDDVYAEIEFFGDNKIGYYARRGRQEWADEITFDGHTLPDGFSQIGFKV